MADPTNDNRRSESAVELARLEGLLPAIQKSFISSVLSIVIFGALLARHSPVGLAVWVGLRVSVSAGLFITLRRLAKTPRQPEQMIRILTVVMAVSGTVWGFVPLLIRPSEPEWCAVVVLWLFGNQSVVTAVCSPSRPVFRAAIGSVTVVGAVGAALYGGSFGLVLAALLLLGGVYSLSIFGPMHQSVNSAIDARLVASSLAGSLTEQQAKLEAANETLNHLASRDELTGLLNRRSFAEALADDTNQLSGDGWLAYLDLDCFKAINDTYGHAAGDRVLQVAARRWLEALPTGGLLARTGGDEFAGWFPDSPHQDARKLASRLNECLESPIAIGDGSVVQVSCSIGMTQTRMGESFPVAAARADRSLYVIKDQGGNDVGVEQHDAAITRAEAPHRSSS